MSGRLSAVDDDVELEASVFKELAEEIEEGKYENAYQVWDAINTELRSKIR